MNFCFIRTRFLINLLLCMMTFNTQFAFSQVGTYVELIKKADSLYEAGEYEKSALSYADAFQSNDWKGTSYDRYNAACSWALAGNKDSAFFNLYRIAEKADYSDYEHISTDIDLFSLHNDQRWQALLLLIRDNKGKIEAGLDKNLIQLLDSMVSEDQKWRIIMKKYWNKEYETDTLSMESIMQYSKLTDSLHYFKLKEIFINHGFPNYDIVGEKGSSNFWLLTQHQDKHPSFQDSVLMKMKIEVDSNKASAINYAYLLDRVMVNTGRLQVYGTQMQLNNDSTSFEPSPVIEPENLNKRRKGTGLDSIESYIQFMNENNAGALKNKK